MPAVKATDNAGHAKDIVRAAQCLHVVQRSFAAADRRTVESRDHLHSISRLVRYSLVTRMRPGPNVSRS